MGLTDVSTSSHEVFGAPCWVSLLARDLSASQEFYSEVLGWKFRASPLGDDFSIGFHRGVPVAGIGAVAENLDVPVTWTPYFAVDDANVTADRIRERMGTVAVGPLTFGTGRAALAADREGAVFGIWEGRVIPDWGVGRETAPAWIELRTRNVFDAAIFYGEVLEWECGRVDCCDVWYHDEGEYVVLRHGGHPVARISAGGVEAAPDPQVRPRWHVHFRVDDLKTAVDAAIELGGVVAAPTETDDVGRSITLRDPDGALFALSVVDAG
ncbi:VOC family protein [Streptomyces sp. NPDC006879]|uniref:VOC family protein n=1 Tax=Streptomyces sp. NPDC006879 TaxID=3364767 RepID=UPI003678A389